MKKQGGGWMKNRLPYDYKCIGTMMSNFDHTVEPNTEEKLKKGNCYADYSAWNFAGYVWWNKNKFSCEIWQYKEYVKTINAQTLYGIMDSASAEFGAQ